MDLSRVEFYETKTLSLKGNRYSVVIKQAFYLINQIERKTKRTPYIKSSYFGRQKVFINLFAQHIFDKKPRERMKRLKLVPCAIELIKESTKEPIIKQTIREKLYRFYGRTKHDLAFVVQIKQDYRGRKYWMSVFPVK